MSLLMYVNEEIDERRGLEYIRRNASRDVFHQVLSKTWKGERKVRGFERKGELIFLMSFELLHTASNHHRIVRVRQITAPFEVKNYKSHHHSTFLIALDEYGEVIGAYNDTLSLTG